LIFLGHELAATAVVFIAEFTTEEFFFAYMLPAFIA